MFQKATRQQVKLKLALTGPAGSGKTMSANMLARGLVGPEGRIALLDTENESASLYSDRFNFDVCNIGRAEKEDPNAYIKPIRAAIEAGYDCLIVDSFSHIWEAVLSYKGKMDAAGGNSFTNWNKAGEKFANALNEVLFAPVHVIVCLRAKTEYVIEQNEKGKAIPRKIGMAPITRAGTDFEFTTVFDLSVEGHFASTSKDRTGLFDEKIFVITEDTGREIGDWLRSGNSPTVEKQAEFVKSELPNAKPVENAKAVATDDIKPATLDALKRAWTAAKKDDKDIAAACQWAGSPETELEHLTESEGQKLLEEVRKQATKLRVETEKAEQAKDDVPFDFPSDLQWLEAEESKVNAKLTEWGWIEAGQTYRDLSPENIAKIKGRPEKFCRAVGIQQPTTANV